MTGIKGLFKKAFVTALVGFALVGTGALAEGVEQIIQVASDEVAVGPEATNAVFEVSYTTDPVEEQSTGLKLQIFYDSRVISFAERSAGKVDAGDFTEGVEYEISKVGTTDFTVIGAVDNDKGTKFTATGAGEGSGNAVEVCKTETQTCTNEELASFLTGFQDTADAGNEDSNEETDRYVLVAYADLTGNGFPGDEVDFPVVLFTQNFKKADTDFEGTTSVTFVAEPGSGNTSKVPENFNIRFKGDEIAPTITLAETSITIEAEGLLTPETSDQLTAFFAGLTADDNVFGDISSDIVKSVGGETADVLEFAIGDTVVDLVVKDPSGNEGTGQVTITVVDTTGPLLSGVSDVALDAVNANGAASAGQIQATASDLVDGPLEVVLTVGGNELPANYPIGVTEVTVTATDKSGITSTGTLLVTVTDVTDPIIASSPVSLEADGASGYAGSKDAILAAVSATDNVDDAPVVTLSDDSLGDLPLGPTQVAVTVKDAAGNSTEGTVSVTVVDTTKPTITVSNLVLTVDSTDEVVASNDARVTAWIENVAATDIVDGATTVTNSALPENFAVGETNVTFYIL